ncbi:5-deoxy-glucuronate isomerase [Lachnospiraceae bacterium ZAX-1]
MSELFGYPTYNVDGKKELTSTEGIYKEAFMNISSYAMKAKDVKEFYIEKEEMAVLLITGDVEYCWEDQRERMVRKDCFTESLFCLHVCKGIKVVVKAFNDTEILVQSTENERTFPAKLYKPKDCVEAWSGVGLCDGKALRKVRTAFDYENAPYSNMVLGEIIGDQGAWVGYIPHSHPQPEVYYYHFDKPQGFGACFVGDEVFKIKDGSFSLLRGGCTHPQVSAPGYPMYVVWMIRHLEGNPWTGRIDDPDHTWMVEIPIQYK